MNEEEIINSIKNRILAEHNKHASLDWAKIAAIKIYKSYNITKKENEKS